MNLPTKTIPSAGGVTRVEFTSVKDFVQKIRIELTQPEVGQGAFWCHGPEAFDHPDLRNEPTAFTTDPFSNAGFRYKDYNIKPGHSLWVGGGRPPYSGGDDNDQLAKVVVYRATLLGVVDPSSPGVPVPMPSPCCAFRLASGLAKKGSSVTVYMNSSGKSVVVSVRSDVQCTLATLPGKHHKPSLSLVMDGGVLTSILVEKNQHLQISSSVADAAWDIVEVHPVQLLSK